MLDFTFLTDDFYNDYSDCSEIEQKNRRPYIRIKVEIDGVLFAIPLRSSINHGHVLWTDKENGCGVDFSKAVVITDQARYINTQSQPYIRPNEFNVLRGKEQQVKEKMRKYISDYKKAKRKPRIPRNKTLLECSTLQYFEEYI